MLTAHPDIAQATVVAREGQPGGTPLVGYVVTINGNGCRSDSLREDLRRCLSNDLMPAPLIMLDALAATSDGKLDHDTILLAQAQLSPARPGAQNTTKQLLCELIAKVLGLPQSISTTTLRTGR